MGTINNDELKNPMIAIYSAKHGAGKTTLAKALESIFEERGVYAFCLSFAHALKKDLDYIMDSTNDDNQKEWLRAGKEDTLSFLPQGKTKRQVFIDYGRFARETFGKDWWVKALINQIEDLNGTPSVFIIDDLRFPEEYDFLRGEGADIIWLNGRCGKEAQDSLSEGLLDQRLQEDHNYRINNTGTRGELWDLANQFVSNWLDNPDHKWLIHKY